MQAFHSPPVVVVAIYQSADDTVTAALASFMTAIIASDDIGSAEWALLARATHRLACIAAIAKHERLALGS